MNKFSYYTLANLIGRLLHNLSPRRRLQFFLLMLLTLVNALAEVVSLGAVLPFLGALIAPDKLFNGNALAAGFINFFGISSPHQLVLGISITFGACALIAGSIRLLMFWVNTRLAFASGADLGIEMYRRTLYQPYAVHLMRNSSEVISSSAKVNTIIFGILLPLLTLLTSIILLVAIVITLFSINALVASIAIFGFGISYLIISFLTSFQLKMNSKRMATESTYLIKAQQEGLGGIRDILLDGTQEYYCKIYQNANQSLRRALSNSVFLGSSPRYLMETLGMLLIIALTYGLSNKDGGVAEALPILGVLALGSQRLIPTLQQIYSSWASILSTYEPLVEVVEMLDQPLPKSGVNELTSPLVFKGEIVLDAVRFRYSQVTPWILNGLNLCIPKGSRVGFIGQSGSGKSTTLDLIMGLLEPTEGSILVDGQSISGSYLDSWQRAVAHVPQSIYLSDASLAENIAFGIPLDQINMALVQEVSRLAHISNFIESCAEGYKTIVGERGARLSGGQRQRIGIARALYKRAQVLVFDEATSALDNATEESVINTIKALDRGLTILVIAHRLSTVSACDFIVEIEGGRAVVKGTYEEIIEKIKG